MQRDRNGGCHCGEETEEKEEGRRVGFLTHTKVGLIPNGADPMVVVFFFRGRRVNHKQ